MPNPWWVISGVMGVCVYLCIALYEPGIIDNFRDDGIYLLQARALAQGRGYVLPHIPGNPHGVEYPPLYPVFLAGIWKLFPHFPDNLLIFKGFSFICFLAALLVLYLLLSRVFSESFFTSIAVSAMTGCSVFVAHFAVQVMTEIPYLFGSLLLIAYLLDRDRKSLPLRRHQIVWLMVGSGLLFYLRSQALFLILSIGLYLALRNQRKMSVIYLAGTLPFILPWLAWTGAHAIQPTTDTQSILQVYGGYGFRLGNSYANNGVNAVLSENLNGLWQGFGALLLPDLEREGLHSPLQFLWALVFVLFLAVLIYVLARRKAFFPAIYIGVSLLGLAIWPFPAHYSRFMISLLPFIWLVLFTLTENPPERSPSRWFGRIVLALMALSIVFNLLSIRYLTRYKTVKMAAQSEYNLIFQEVRKRVPESAVIGAAHGELVSLFTDRLTWPVHHNLIREGWVLPAYSQKDLQAYADRLQRNGVSYLLSMSEETPYDAMPEQSVVDVLVALSPARYELLASSPSGILKLYRVR